MIHRKSKGLMMMSVYRISLMDAYLIETLRSNGVSNEEIVSTVKEGDVGAWQEQYAQFDFNMLLALAQENIAEFEKALEQGYQVKFITFNGLKNLLRMRFGKEEEKDYELTEKGIKNLLLNEEQYVQVKQMLSGNWVFTEVKAGEESVVNIELI